MTFLKAVDPTGKYIAAISLMLLIVGCSGGPVAPDIPLGDLLNAPEVITIDGREYSLDAAAGRDFMPGQ